MIELLTLLKDFKVYYLEYISRWKSIRIVVDNEFSDYFSNKNLNTIFTFKIKLNIYDNELDVKFKKKIDIYD